MVVPPPFRGWVGTARATMALSAFAARALQEFEAMKIRVGCDLTYTFAAPTPMVLMLNVHPDRAADLLVPDVVRITPFRPVSVHADMFGNTCARLIAPAGELRIV